MTIYIVGLVFVIAFLVIGIVYLSNAFGRFGLIRKIAGEKKWKSRLISLTVLLGGFGLFALLLSAIDAVIILLHVLFFFLLYGLLFRIIGKKMRAKIYLQGWLALLTAGAYLLTGYIQCVHVWKTEYSLTTDRPISGLRIAVLADSHIGTTFDGAGFAAYVDEIMRQDPDLILIPGDLVDDDTRREDLLTACETLGKADPEYGVWFAYGNHDRGYFGSRDFSAAELADILKENGVRILEDEAAYIGDLCIVGRRDASSGPRSDMSALMEGVERDRYIIVLDHEPTDYDSEAAVGPDLVVSGHTHGGQLIPLGLIGRWFGGNDREYGHERRGGTDFIVTSGISDWAVHFKTGAHSEYVIITVTGTDN